MQLNELQQQGLLLNQTITYSILPPKAVYNIWRKFLKSHQNQDGPIFVK